MKTFHYFRCLFYPRPYRPLQVVKRAQMACATLLAVPENALRRAAGTSKRAAGIPGGGPRACSNPLWWRSAPAPWVKDYSAGTGVWLAGSRHLRAADPPPTRFFALAVPLPSVPLPCFSCLALSFLPSLSPPSLSEESRG